MIEVDLDVLGREERPYFAARFRDGRVEVEGVAECIQGRKLIGPVPNQPDGVFVEWRWDGSRLEVCNDRYGMSPLFYSCHGNEIRVSPSITQVLKGNAPRELDYPALAVLLRMGHPVGEDTPFRHIRALPPSSVLIWEQGQIRINSAELPIRRETISSLSFDDAVDRFAHLFDQAIEKRLPENDDVIMPLSGGRDSRHILFALDAHGVKPQSCVTLKFRPPSTNEDARIARLIADEIGTDHVVIEKAPSWFQAVLKEVPLSNLTAGSHSWVLPLAAYLKGRTSTVYDGLAGSVLSGGFMTDERRIALYREGKLSDLAILMLSEGREGFINTVLRRPFRERVSMSVAVTRLVKELKRHQDASNPMLSFIFWNRTRRGVSQIPLSIMSHIPTVHCPYLDHEVYDFIIGVDQTYLLKNRLHDEVIRRAYPQYRHLPYENQSTKAIYRAEDHAYFRKSVKEMWWYLLRRRLRSSKLVRGEYIYARLLYDLLRQRNRSPWYLTGTTYCLEFERILQENTGDDNSSIPTL